MPLPVHFFFLLQFFEEATNPRTLLQLNKADQQKKNVKLSKL